MGLLWEDGELALLISLKKKNKQHKRGMHGIRHSQIPLELSHINSVLCHNEFSRACSEDIIKQPAIVET